MDSFFLCVHDLDIALNRRLNAEQTAEEHIRNVHRLRHRLRCSKPMALSREEFKRGRDSSFLELLVAKLTLTARYDWVVCAMNEGNRRAYLGNVVSGRSILVDFDTFGVGSNQSNGVIALELMRSLEDVDQIGDSIN